MDSRLIPSYAELMAAQPPEEHYASKALRNAGTLLGDAVQREQERKFKADQAQQERTLAKWKAMQDIQSRENISRETTDRALGVAGLGLEGRQYAADRGLEKGLAQGRMRLQGIEMSNAAAMGRLQAQNDFKDKNAQAARDALETLYPNFTSMALEDQIDALSNPQLQAYPSIQQTQRTLAGMQNAKERSDYLWAYMGSQQLEKNPYLGLSAEEAFAEEARIQAEIDAEKKNTGWKQSPQGMAARFAALVSVGEAIARNGYKRPAPAGAPAPASAGGSSSSSTSPVIPPLGEQKR